MPDDIALVESLNLKPGPYYSKDLKALNILDNKHLEVKYGCDEPNQDILDPSDIWLLLHDGWRVMANWMMSRDHWTVMMGVSSNRGKSRVKPDFILLSIFQ